MTPRVLAEPGDIIVCENGHEICSVVKPVFLTNHAESACFGRFRKGQRKVVAGDASAVLICSICQTQWVKHWTQVESPPRDGFLLRVKPKKGVWV